MLQLKNINKRFGSKTVAQDINLNVEAGEILAVLGRSGCGKSTLLKTIVGLVHPDSGEVWLNGDNITDMPSEKRNISLMFQDYALLPHLTALDNVGFGLKMRRLPKADIEEQSMQALRDIGLEHEAQRKPESLSGGEQQRLALARALITRPSLLLLDEAFSSLDTHLRHHLRTLTAERIRSQNIPAILVTHSAEEACTMADTIAIMHEGRILQHGTPETLIRRPVNAQAALLLGLANTGDTRYIPQHAIRFDPNGTSVRINEAVPLAEGTRLTLVHPQYGDLIWYPHADHDTDKPQTGQEIRISVDESQIVWFD
ncbi:ABC transporter ATP-binding protein [Neisseria sp. 27098_8_139]|uniref:ABC transporter ATP-binding protein n=1 Tax=unclassified Neisseria TaxID=2623750 RepID=UPI00066DDB42